MTKNKINKFQLTIEFGFRASWLSLQGTAAPAGLAPGYGHSPPGVFIPPKRNLDDPEIPGKILIL